jgi:hypothetical protein
MSIIQGNSKTSAAGGYTIDQSIRFNDDDSAYLSRAMGTGGDTKTGTLSLWVKRANLGTTQLFFSQVVSSRNSDIRFKSDDTIQFYLQETAGAGYALNKTSSNVYRDVGGWYHIYATWDTTQSSPEWNLYVNGVQPTWATDSNNGMSQNADIAFFGNSNMALGRTSNAATSYTDAYLAEINCIEGSVVAISEFAETNADTGQWVPKKYTGSYPGKSFYITGADSADLGADQAGSNDFTSNNLSADDQTLDTPTPNSESGVGNFNAMSPLIPLANSTGAVLSEGNTKITHSSASYKGFASNFPIPTSGKWGFQATLGTTGAANSHYWGIATDSAGNPVPTNSIAVPSYWYTAVTIGTYDGNVYVKNSGGSQTTHYNGPQMSTGDEIEFLVDMDAGTLDIKRNGSAFGTQYTGMATDLQLWPYASMYVTDIQFDFGQNGYTPSDSDYKTLATQNFPDPTIADPSAYFQTLAYASTGTSTAFVQDGNSQFEPGLVWVKSRTGANNHLWFDQVRGATKFIRSDTTNTENTVADTLTAFNSNGFTAGADSINWGINYPGRNNVAWMWAADGTSGSTNEDGTVTSTVSADTTSGFSIAKWTHTTASNYTVGHGLGAVPKMILVKTTDQSTNWGVYHSDITVGNRLILNSTSAQVAGYWGANSWTSSTFSIGSARDANGSTMIAYSFAEVEGFSKFGSYTGNGSTDGPFIYTGFKPSFIMYKRTSGGTGNWDMLDIKRDPINVSDAVLAADKSTVETTYSTIKIDMVSNGYKIRGTQTNLNASGSAYIYMAFAESPFKTATAR